MKALKNVALALVLITLWGVGCNSSGGSTDGNTNWLGECSRSAACVAGLECICGVCTKRCSRVADCSGLSADATCAPPSSTDVCDIRRASGICARACVRDGDCPADGRCVGGICSPFGSSSTDGGEETDAARRTDDAGNTDAGALASNDAGAPLADGGHGGATTDASLDGAPPSTEGGSNPDSGTTTCPDDDGDGVCNAVDVCPGFDDHVDSDSDGRPDGCEPTLLEDINTATADSSPSDFAQVNDDLFFVAGAPVRTREVWTIPASGGAPVRVTNINTDPNTPAAIDHLTTVGSRVFFTVANTTGVGFERIWAVDDTPGADAAELATTDAISVAAATSADGLFYVIMEASGDQQVWRSDGTVAGTFQVSSTFASSLESNGVGSGVLGANFFFTAGNDGTDSRLWTTDGTVAGTIALTSQTDLVEPSSFVTSGGRMYFLVAPSLSSTQSSIWSTDGTVAGTHLAFASLPSNLNPTFLVATSTHLFFTLYDSTSPSTSTPPSLWATTGEGVAPTELNVAGTVFPAGDVAYVLTNSGVFADLFLTDGSTPSTPIMGLPGSTYSSWGQVGTAATTSSGGAYFVGEDLIDNGYTLFFTDGKSVTTLSSVDLHVTNPGLSAVFGDRLFFSTSTPDHGLEPWVSDGTAAGTHELADVNQDTLDSSPSQFSSAALPGSPVVFSARDNAHGLEPWVAPASAPGARLLADTVSGPGDGFVTPWASTGADSFFVAPSATNLSTLYRVDPSAALIAANGGAVADATAYPTASGILFSASPGIEIVSPNDLVTSTPTIANALTLDGISNSTPTVVSALDWHGVTWVNDGTSVFRTDGTAHGTETVAPFAKAGALFALDDGVYYTGTDSKIYRADLSANAPKVIVDPANSGMEPNTFPVGTFKGYLYFEAENATFQDQLCRANGSGFEVFSTDISMPGAPAIIGDRMFLADYNHALWVTDGTQNGTVKLSTNVYPSQVVAYRGLAYFAADDGTHGTELWRSDGTNAGTFMESDIEPGSRGSSPTNLYAAPDALYFQAATTKYGLEPWVMRH